MGQAVSEGFPGERREHHMRKLARSNQAVTCGSCRQFDGLAWCRRWNFHTGPESPICDQYRPAGTARSRPDGSAPAR
jgi:hypothetical protein